jgi:5-methylthioadenosine/S-adenosylhomocysteine deaminase
LPRCRRCWLAALLHKVASGDPTTLPAAQALAMATRLGAAAIHKAGEIGQLRVGLQADLIQVTMNKTRHQPLYDVSSHLVYVLDSTDVVTTVVAGQLLMQDRQVLTIDEVALRKAVAARSADIRAALANRNKAGEE